VRRAVSLFIPKDIRRQVRAGEACPHLPAETFSLIGLAARCNAARGGLAGGAAPKVLMASAASG